MDQELSFSASASGKSPSPTGKAPAKQLAQWPKAAPAPVRPKAVSFDRHSDSELSFTVEDASTSHSASPLILVEQQHIVDSERMQRHRLRDEEAALWQHTVRVGASSKLSAEGLAMSREAKILKELPLSAGAADVAPLMKKYLNELKHVPETTELATLKKERETLDKKVEQEKQRADALAREAAIRKSYTDEVVKNIEEQERVNVETTHNAQKEARAQHSSRVTEVASQFRQDMSRNEQERLDKLRVRHAYVKLHGNYEARVDQGESLRLERLAAIAPKVQSQHSVAFVDAATGLKKKIQENAERRRAKAVELAEKQTQLQQERIEARKEILHSQLVLERELDVMDRQVQEDACRSYKQAASELNEVKLEREKTTFLNRMTCNADFNDEVDALRNKRLQERKSLWSEKQSLAADRQRVAEHAAAAEKQNKAKLRIIDRLMAEEAILVNDATRRLHNRNMAERRRDEKTLLLEAENLSKHKVLEEIYSHRQHTTSPTNPHLPSISVTPSGSPQRGHERLQCYAVVEDEEQQRVKFLKRFFPEKTRVLPLDSKVNKSLAFASRETLKSLKTSNPRLAELASRLAELESADAVQKNEMSIEERHQTRTRLTKRTAAQDARRVVHDGYDAPPTIHDGVPKQHGVSSRLYPKALHSAAPQVQQKMVNDDAAEEEIKHFVTRFYSEPIRRQEQAMATAHSRTKAHIATTPPLRMTDKELANVKDRLYYTGIRHLSPVLERRMDEREHRRETSAQHRITNEDAIERFYTSAVKSERESLQKLDEKYLS
ncbi:Hypothetical protein, putative [Bodo saltans]|uniref:Uncharacterized protein n=1 Tax=Bodo saltans TaxID=75058 RepID=A0A0S4JCN8_BODSA|nr:Hypothetical protein, putative [Bodo saltans]|eukprot:CUG87895.1 Hypothetical protein, putative [Bodo saltans]